MVVYGGWGVQNGTENMHSPLQRARRIFECGAELGRLISDSCFLISDSWLLASDSCY